MKKLITILIIFCSLQSQGQTYRSGTSTATTAPVVYTKAGTDAAIAAAIKLQADKQASIDAAQNARLAVLEAMEIIFDKRYTKVVGNTVTINIDSIQAYLKFPTTDLTAINNSITSLNIRTTSLEQWRTLSQNDIDKLKLQVTAIPTKAISTTTTILQ